METGKDEVTLSGDSPSFSAEDFNALKKEYEKFTYIISHDLAAPLRHIRQFSTLLLQSFEDSLDERQEKFASHITDSVDRCQGMIDGLLLLSKVDTEEAAFSPLNINSLVEQTVHAKLLPVKDCESKLALESIPQILANKQQLGSVLFHLIDNAVKFHRHDVPLEISISTEQKENSVLLCIEDNGIGIDQSNRESVFEVFKTLGNNGIGVGLTLCRKIVTKHGGKIWNANASNGGAVFYVSLPIIR